MSTTQMYTPPEFWERADKMHGHMVTTVRIGSHVTLRNAGRSQLWGESPPLIISKEEAESLGWRMFQVYEDGKPSLH